MKLSILATASAVALLSASMAHATPPGNNGGGNGGCGNGQQTNGCGGTTVSPDIDVSPVIDVRPTTVIAPNISPDIRTTTTVAPVIAPNISPDIRNAVDNRDTNVVGVDTRDTNINGQHQVAASSSSSGASSDQSQSLIDNSQHSLSSITAATTGASTSGATSSSAGQTATYTDNSVYEAQKRAPVASAYSAPLSIGGGVCAYTPVSGSGQFVSFGLSGSAAKIDEGCERRATADMFARLGQFHAACSVLISDPKIARWLPAGYACPADPPAVTLDAEPTPPPVAAPAITPLPDIPPKKYDGERG